MYSSRSALTVVRRRFPRVRIHRLRPAVFKFLNAVVILSMAVPNLTAFAARSIDLESTEVLQESHALFPTQNPNVSETPNITVSSSHETITNESDLVLPPEDSFVVADGPEFKRNAVVAYDGVNQRFLFVWSEPLDPECLEGPTCYDRIVGQLVTLDGTLIGGQFEIVNSYPTPDEFHLAFNEGTQTYLLVFGYINLDELFTGAGSDINVRILDINGAPIGIGDGMSDAYTRDMLYMDQEDAYAILYRRPYPENPNYNLSGIIRLEADGTLGFGSEYESRYNPPWVFAYNTLENRIFSAVPGEGGMGFMTMDAATFGDQQWGSYVDHPIIYGISGYGLAFNDTTSELLYIYKRIMDYDSLYGYGYRLTDTGYPLGTNPDFEIVFGEDSSTEWDVVGKSGIDGYLLLDQGSIQWVKGDGSLRGDSFGFMTEVHGICLDDYYWVNPETPDCSGMPSVTTVDDELIDFLVAWVDQVWILDNNSDIVGITTEVRGLPISWTGSIVQDDAVLSDCGDSADDRGCGVSSQAATQGEGGLNSINSRTGGMDFTTVDLGFPTSAGPLIFERTYSSLATDRYTDTLGYGWTHNHDTRLIFPSDPEGREGYVRFKAHSANLYDIVDNGDGTYASTAGVGVTLTQDAGPPITYTLTDPAQRVYTFDENGRLLTWADAQGHTWTYEYDPEGRLTSIEDDISGRYIALAYDAQGRLETVSDHTERDVHYAYDAAGDLVTVTDVLDQDWTYEYDGEHRLEYVRDPRQEVVERTEYDAQGRAWRQSDGEGNPVVEITYNADGTSTLRDALGNESVHEYDSRSTLVATYDPAGNDVQKTYDDNFRPTTITDENENKAELIWSDDGINLLQVTVDEEIDPTIMEYDALNNLKRIQDASGAEIILEYEGKLLTYSEDDLGNPTTYTYTPEGYLESIEDARGTVTYYTYDDNGQRETTTLNYDPSYPQNHENKYNIVTTYVYDDLGNQVEVIDTYGRRTRYGYDAAGRLTRLTRNFDPNHPQNYENQYNIVTEYVYDEVGNQIEVVDTYGRITRKEYDSAGRLTRTIRNYDYYHAQNDQNEYNIVTEYVYDEVSNLIEVIDTFGRRMRYEYNDTGRLFRTTQNYDPNLAQNYDNQYNIVTEYEYDAAGNQIQVIDTYDRITRYEYDHLNRKTAVIANYVDGGPVNHETNVRTEYEYDEVGNLINTIDAMDRITFNEYDSLGRVKRTWQNYDPNRPQNDQNEYNIVTEYVYNEVGQRVQTIDSRENPTSYEYDALGRLEIVTDALSGTTVYTYDALGNRLAVTDAENNATTYEYDSLNRQLSVEDAEQHTAYTAYDALGNVNSRTDSNGVETRYEYDTLNRQTAVIVNYLEGTPADHEANVRSEYVYDAVGNQRFVYDANGNPTEMIYDALDRSIIVEDALENTTETEYDALGNVMVVRDGLGNPTSYAYDPLGRQETVTDAELNSTTSAYDALGNRVSMIDANGVVTRFEYDGLNRLTAVVENYLDGEPEDHETNVRTEYSYDPNGNRIEILDGSDHWTRFEYDALNRLVYESDMLENITEYGYDKVGKKEWMKDAEGEYTYYEYDKVGRLTVIDYPDPDVDVTFTYDANGNRETMTDGMGDTIWDYDPLGRVTSVQDPFDDTISYVYDANGNRQELDYPGGEAVSYVYDAVNRLKEVHDWTASGVTYYSYDDANRLETVTLPNGVVTTYTYDDAGQLLTLTHEADGTTLSSFGYTYDSVGNRVQAVEYYLTPGSGGGPTISVQVVDERGDPLPGLPVYAFDGTTYTGYHETTDENGEAAITLPEGIYRFRVDVDGTQFWSGESNHCAVAGCTEVLFTIPDPVLVSVRDTGGMPMEGLPVYVFDESSYTGKHATTDENGEVILRLVEGSYRFRADLNGTKFWSGESNHCTVSGCTLADVRVTIPVTVTVTDSLGMSAVGIPVYAFSGGSYSGYHGTSGADGRVTLTLPQGDYRFRADSNGTRFWSGESDHCGVPGCLDAAVEITLPVIVTVLDTDGQPAEGLTVYAFDGTTYTGFHATTDSAGQVSLTLPQGDYRFRADKNGTQFWSGGTNHCAVPGCTETSVTVTIPVTVSVLDINEQPLEGVPVYAFDDSTYSGYHAATNAAGEVVLTLPQGDYRFRADKNGNQFWSGESNHCSIPGCARVEIIAGETPPASETPTPSATATGTATATSTPTATATSTATATPTGTATPTSTESAYLAGRGLAMPLPGRMAQDTLVAITVLDTDGQPAEGLPVYAFTESVYTGVHGTTDAAGQVSLDLTDGAYRFRADKNGTYFWSGGSNHCTVPDCTEASITVTLPVNITVLDTDGQPAVGLPVYAFDESAYSGYHATTDVSGQVSLTLPQGDYRFRADKNGTQFWSGGSNHCTLPGCTEVAITVTLPVTITVLDTEGQPAEGLPIYAFDESAYTGFHATTDAAGQVSLTLPQGDYRFRADKNGTQFWSGESNHCTLPGCTEAAITVTLPVTVTVLDTDGQPAEGLPVYAFDESAYTGFHATTDAAGQVSLTLPQGDYRFRADKNGTHFWSGESNHCALPSCTEAGITVTIPVIVTVGGQSGDPYPNLPVYAFSGDSYTGFHATTDENGQVSLTLPQGDYRFRADYDGVHFWSGETDHCVVPDCLEATVELPGGGTAAQSVTIDYTYDPLYRLTNADYDTGEYFHYTYDAVGNRLTQETLAGTNTYTYDNANRLTEVDGVSYTWSATGNLLSDGENTYTYNHANRLTGVVQGEDTYNFAYNGLGDRLTQTVNGEATLYTLDVVMGLTQVLDDGTNVYLYGLDRVGEEQAAGWAYHLPDALGSVRQLVDANASVTLSQSYEPFGSVMATSGPGETNYSYTGEWADGTGLMHLRARYYAPWQGRFMSKDTWQGESSHPISFNQWLFGNSAPITFSDPSGHDPIPYDRKNPCWRYKAGTVDYKECRLYAFYQSRWSVTQEPPVENWDPAVHVQLASLIPENQPDAQYYVCDYPGQPSCIEDTNRGRYGYKLCGQVSLSMILETVTSSWLTLDDLINYEINEWLGDCWYDLDNDKKKDQGEVVACGWPKATTGGTLKKLAEEVFPPGWWAAYRDWDENQLVFKIRNSLRRGNYLITLTKQKISFQMGEIVTSGGHGHWVVLTAFSSPANLVHEDSYFNWVRINNPYNNREEYYLWSDFKRSMDNATSYDAFGVLEIWYQDNVQRLPPR